MNRRAARGSLSCAALALAVLVPFPALAQEPRTGALTVNSPRAASEPTGGSAAKRAGTQADDPDLDVNLSQPEFALIALPTTLRVPRHAMTFRLTHRFYEPLDQAGVSDLWGLDFGAQVGLEFRFGLARGVQIGVHRTSDRTIEFFSAWSIAQQGAGMPFGVSALAAVEGLNNFKETYSPSFGAIVSRELGTRGALYAEPMWVGQSLAVAGSRGDRTSTVVVGLGVRLRVLSSTYVVAEFAPRTASSSQATPHTSFGIEKRVGGHLFQLNVSTDQGTTFGQIARGGTVPRQWYLGFNLARKFY